MKLRKILSGVSLIVASQILTLPFFSCSNKKDINNKLTVIGPDKIYIDQTKAQTIQGQSTSNWIVKQGEQVIEQNNLTFQILDCDDNSIFFGDSTIKWSNPTLKNHTFKIKASYIDDVTKQEIYGISDNVTLMADSETVKFEFLNEGSQSPYTINTQSGKSGQQDGNWILKFNGKPYSGEKSQLKLCDSNGMQIQGISIDSDGKIYWDDSLVYGAYQLYLSVDIKDSETGKFYNIVASNNPIELNVKKAPIYFGTNEKVETSFEAYTTNEITRYQLFDSNGVEITTDPTVSWTIKKAEDSADFGDNITIQNGVVRSTNNLPKGIYKFNAIARKSGLTSPVISKDIIVSTYIPYVINGINEHIIALHYDEKKETIDSDNIWSLYWGNQKMLNVQFEIVPISDSQVEIERTDKLKKSVKIHRINDTDVCFKWDGKLDGGYYDFKLQAKYDNETILSNPISLKSVYDYGSYINIGGGSKKILCLNVPKKSKKGAHDGKLQNPFTVRLKDYHSDIDWNKIEFSFEDTNGINFNLEKDAKDPTKSYLVWDNIKDFAFEQSSWKIFHPKLIVKYKTDNETLTDSLVFDFTVGDFFAQDSGILLTDGNSYNINEVVNKFAWDHMGLGGSSPGDTLYFKYIDNQTTAIKQTLNGIPWGETQIKATESYSLMASMLKTTSKNAKQRAQFQRFSLNVMLPAKTQFSFKLYCHGCFAASSSWGTTVQYRELGRRVDIYNLNSRILPDAIHPWRTVNDPRNNHIVCSDAINYDVVKDRLCHDCIHRFDKDVHTFDSSKDFYFDFKPISITLTNYTSHSKRVSYYFGLSGITTQGSATFGPDTNLSLNAEFSISDQTVKAV